MTYTEVMLIELVRIREIPLRLTSQVQLGIPSRR